MERETRFELATLALARRCSTTELLPLSARLSIPGGRGQNGSNRGRAAGGGRAAPDREPFSSRTISPSRMYRMRLAIEAASGLWVIISVVWPSSRFDEQHLQHGVGVLGVQVAGGLVGQHNGRPRNQRARNGHPLLLAAAQLRGPVLEPPLNRQQIAQMVEILQVQGSLRPLTA
jgi:hypothetical protein